MDLLYVLALSLLTTIAIARYHAYLFDVKQQRIDHTFWAAVWLIANMVIVGVFAEAFNEVSKRLLWLLSLIVFRLPSFNVILNYFRRPRKPFFYLDKHKDGSDSGIDMLIKNIYPPVFFLCIIIFLTIQVYLWLQL